MVEVGEKQPTRREAAAEGWIAVSPDGMRAVLERTAKKGDVLAVAQLAGIGGAKKTADLIPLCHPLMLTHVSLEFELDATSSAVRCTVTTRTRERTGVEMEALTAVQVALLTIYDMCKAVDRGMVINDVCLVHKSGGKSGEWNRQP